MNANNINHLLRGCEFNIQKYYMSAICRTNVILLYWTKQPLNKWFIISLGKLLDIRISTKAITSNIALPASFEVYLN